MRLWPRRHDPAPDSGPDPDDDAVARWGRDLAGSYRDDPGVPVWSGLLDDHTRLIPVVTPAARMRGWGDR